MKMIAIKITNKWTNKASLYPVIYYDFTEATHQLNILNNQRGNNNIFELLSIDE